MLTWHNVWMASHGREMARELKAAGHEVVTGKRTLAALGVVVGVAVLREGSEVVLFLYGIAAQGGISNAGLLAGGALGLAAGAAVSALMYFGPSQHSGRAAVPGHIGPDHTSGGRHGGAGGAVPAEWRLYQCLDGHDLGHVLAAQGRIHPGRLLHTLVGYVQAPDGAQVAAYLATIAGILLLMRMTGRPSLPSAPSRLNNSLNCRDFLGFW